MAQVVAAGTQHDDDAEKPHYNGRNPPDANLFAQKEDRQHRNKQGRDEEQGRRIGQRDGCHGCEQGHIGDNHAQASQRMQGPILSAQSGKAALELQHGQAEDNRHQRADKNHLVQGIAAGELLNQDVIDRDERHARTDKGNAQTWIVRWLSGLWGHARSGIEVSGFGRQEAVEQCRTNTHIERVGNLRIPKLRR